MAPYETDAEVDSVLAQHLMGQREVMDGIRRGTLDRDDLAVNVFNLAEIQRGVAHASGGHRHIQNDVVVGSSV